MNNSRICSVVLTLIAFLSVSHPALTQVKRALLIGINTYNPARDGAAGNAELSAQSGTANGKQEHQPDSRFSSAASWQNLRGPEDDVKNMAALLPQFNTVELYNAFTGRPFD